MTKETKEEPQLSWFTALTTYFAYGVLILIGHVRDFVGRVTGRTRWKSLLHSETKAKGYAPLFQSWENFYTRRLYYRIQDVFNRPICSSPSAWIDVQVRAARGAARGVGSSSSPLDARHTRGPRARAPPQMARRTATGPRASSTSR